MSITKILGPVDMTKTIMSAISSALSVTEEFNFECCILAASKISVSTKPGLMLCMGRKNKNIKIMLLNFYKIFVNFVDNLIDK